MNHGKNKLNGNQMAEKSSRGKKREITTEEISNYVKQGYYFRVKEVNGTRYITRRKSREEKSLGRYTDEVWSMIEQEQKHKDKATDGKPAEIISEKPDEPTPLNTLGLLEQIIEEVAIGKGLIMYIGCLHNVEGTCTYWHWETKPGFFDTLDRLDASGPRSYKLTDIVHKGQIVKRWTVKAQVAFCMNCPAYISEKDIAFVEAFKLHALRVES